MKKYLVMLLIVGCIASMGFAKDKGIVISTTKPFKVVRNINPNEYSKKYWVDVTKVESFPECEGEYIDYAFGVYYEVDAQEKAKRDAAIAAKELVRTLEYNKQAFQSIVPVWQWTQHDQYVKDNIITQATQDSFLLWIEEGIQKSRLTTAVNWTEFVSRRPSY